MTDVEDLIGWFKAEVDADEARARKLLANAQQTVLTLRDPRHLGKFIPGWHDWPDVVQMCTERLAEIEAKRQILNKVTQALATASEHFTVESCDEDDAILAEGVLRLLAAPYADREGYRPEWKPA